jgi:hypothetical protein
VPFGTCTIRGDDAGSDGSLTVKRIGSKWISSRKVTANAARGGAKAKSATALAATSRVIKILPGRRGPSPAQHLTLIALHCSRELLATNRDQPMSGINVVAKVMFILAFGQGRSVAGSRPARVGV